MRKDKAGIFTLITIILLGLLLTVSWMLLPEREPWVSKPPIELVKEQHESELMALEGVVGVGISKCQGKPCIEVYLADESSNLKQQIPTQLNGYQINTKVMGRIEAETQP